MFEVKCVVKGGEREPVETCCVRILLKRKTSSCTLKSKLSSTQTKSLMMTHSDWHTLMWDLIVPMVYGLVSLWHYWIPMSRVILALNCQSVFQNFLLLQKRKKKLTGHVWQKAEVCQCSQSTIFFLIKLLNGHLVYKTLPERDGKKGVDRETVNGVLGVGRSKWVNKHTKRRGWVSFHENEWNLTLFWAYEWTHSQTGRREEGGR